MIELCCEYLSLRCNWLHVIIMSRMSFRVNLHPMICLNVKERLAQSRHRIWSLRNSNDIRTHNHLVHKQTLNHLATLAKWLSCVVSTYLYDATECYCHVTYDFQSVSTLYGLPECQRLLVWSRHHIWSLSDSSKIQTHNHLVCKQTLNHFTKLAKWLSCVVSTYLYGAFDCMLLSCHVQVSE